MRLFKLVRSEDVSGVSGTGVIAEGVEFHDGQVALSWFGVHHTVELCPSIKDIIEIHGHGGRTVVEWLDEAQAHPSCHACGSPIFIGQDIAIYCKGCDENRG